MTDTHDGRFLVFLFFALTRVHFPNMSSCIVDKFFYFSYFISYYLSIALPICLAHKSTSNVCFLHLWFYILLMLYA